MNGLFTQPDYSKELAAGVQLANVPTGKMGLAMQPMLGAIQNNAIGGLLTGVGVESPEVKAKRALEGILGGINPQDSTSLQRAASQLLSMGMTAEAQQLMEEARKVNESQSKVGLQGAQATQAMASAQKDLTQAKVYAKEAATKGYPPRTVALIASGASEEEVAASLSRELQISEAESLAKIQKDKASVVQSYAAANASNANAEYLKAKIPFVGSEAGMGGGMAKDVQVAQRTALLRQKQLDGTITQQESFELEGLTTPKQTTVGEKAVNENVAAYDTVNQALYGFESAEKSITGLMNSNVKWKSGALRSMSEYMKEIAGTEDEATIANLRTEASQIEKQLAALPRGPASDKDMAVAARVRLGKYANPQALLDDISYMKGAAERVKKGIMFKDKYLSEHKNLSGFVTAYEKAMSGETVNENTTSQKKLTANLPDGKYSRNGKIVTVKDGVVYE